jgi:hypothetical protein
MTFVLVGLAVGFFGYVFAFGGSRATRRSASA